MTPTVDVHTLTGGYVLNAVSDTERQAFEHHLVTCHACAAELIELRETATRLGIATARTPPAALWHNISIAVRTTRQLPPLLAVPAPRISAGRRRRAAVVVTAVAAAVAIAVGTGLVNQSKSLEHRLAQTDNRLATIGSILAAPDARMRQKTELDGRTATVVISGSAKGMLLTTHNLPAVPGHSIQAWFRLTDGRSVSAGLLDPATGTLLAADQPAAGPASAVILTVEPVEGATVPSGNVVMAVPLAG